MELLTVTLAILSIAEKVFSLKDKFSSKKSNLKLDEWLHSTGDLLSSISKALRENRYPHDKCAQLKYTLDQMNLALQSYLSQSQIEELYTLINSAYQVERMFGEMQSLTEEEKEYNIQAIESAVGKFYAAANFIKLSI